MLTMLFFWEWLWTLNPDSETGEAVTSHMVYFPIVKLPLHMTRLHDRRQPLEQHPVGRLGMRMAGITVRPASLRPVRRGVCFICIRP